MRFLIIFIFLLIIPAALAHVSYVVDKQTLATTAGEDTSFLTTPLTDPFYLTLILGTIVVILVVYFVVKKSTWCTVELAMIKERAKDYYPLTSWMLRISLGILLIGSGSAGVLLSPSVGAQSFASIQILLGFLLLAGAFMGPALVGVILLYGYAVYTSTYAIGNLEILMACVALLVQANSSPGLDHLLGFSFYPHLKRLEQYVPLILRIGIGGAMTYLAVYEKLLNPHWSEAVVTQYHLTSAIPVSAAMWVLGAGLIELAVGVALLVGFQTRLISVIAFVVLSASFFFFSEAVYSHITLFCVLSVLLVTGGGALSVDEWWHKRKFVMQT